MFPPDQLNSLLREIMARFNGQTSTNTNCTPQHVNSPNNQNGQSSSDNKNNQNKLAVTPAQALIISGLLGGVFEVTSVLVDKDQTVQIVLSGSLKVKKKTDLEKMLDQIGSMPFDEVVKTMIGRLTED